jgi:hypothetical protein
VLLRIRISSTFAAARYSLPNWQAEFESNTKFPLLEPMYSDKILVFVWQEGFKIKSWNTKTLVFWAVTRLPLWTTPPSNVPLTCKTRPLTALDFATSKFLPCCNFSADSTGCSLSSLAILSLLSLLYESLEDVAPCTGRAKFIETNTDLGGLPFPMGRNHTADIRYFEVGCYW